MFKFKNYDISWQFSQITPTQFKKRGVYVNGFCDCVIKDIETEEIYSAGRSFKAIEDSHNKAIGRKHSLKRALDVLCSQMPYDESEAKAFRKEVWEEYFKNCSE